MRRALMFAAIVAMVCGLQAADRAEITFADGRIFPESVTSTKNGDLYFGSLGQDSVYRATANSSTISPIRQHSASSGLRARARAIAISHAASAMPRYTE